MIFLKKLFNMDFGCNILFLAFGCLLALDGILTASVKEIQPSPAFATTGKTFRVATKDSIILPCEVINLGRYILAWKRGGTILTAGPTRVTPDERMRIVEGYNLEIKDIDTNDAGDYICHIATLQPKEITHTVEVLVPARVRRVTTSSTVEVRKGSSVTLECEASGNPVPTIRWSRKNSLLPSGEKSVIGSAYTIEQANKHHSGVYVCTASNDVGPSTSDQIVLQVHYTPEVEVERSWVHTGEGYEAELVCIVHAEPPASVIWFRNTLRLDTTERRIMENRGSRHTLVIRKVEQSDFGNYSCVADNSMGKTREYLYLSGKPHPAVFRSNPVGKSKTSYNITWFVNSYTPIEEYRLSYREIPDSTHPFPHYTSFSSSQLALQRKQQNNEMTYGIAEEFPTANGGLSMYANHWINISLSATPSEKFSQYMWYVIEDLDPVTQYEARVQARNRFGWNEISEPFRFTTKGAEPEMRDLGVKAMNSGIMSASFCFNLILQLAIISTASFLLV